MIQVCMIPRQACVQASVTATLIQVTHVTWETGTCEVAERLRSDGVAAKRNTGELGHSGREEGGDVGDEDVGIVDVRGGMAATGYRPCLHVSAHGMRRR